MIVSHGGGGLDTREEVFGVRLALLLRLLPLRCRLGPQLCTGFGRRIILCVVVYGRCLLEHLLVFDVLLLNALRFTL